MRYRRRRLINLAAQALAVVCTIAVLTPLLLIFGYLLTKGVTSLNFDFFTQLPKPVGETGGGMANAIVGTMVLIGLASALGLPVGVLTGVYLAEFGYGRFGWAVRFCADVLNGVPSIVIGIFAYTLIVLPTKTFSAYAGGFALAVIMLPIVARTTEEMLRLVPTSLREASLALGIPSWRTTVSVVLRTARGGIVTGIMLAVARIAGETAPLLFTAFGNQFWHHGLSGPISSLPVQIFTYAISPFDDWHRQAWAGALILLSLILLTSLSVRFLTRGRFGAVR
ncbi:MAG: phosphate ABC transporter permease PstA [Deltaproteobacteria bacterium]|nr:phosphate ABC transporter permease PstA [Deltaproteobacteria bacterium]MBI3386714.1 phosphate ABC transporter permease PstA [Deltaproteobacteria bacterium]